MHSVPKLRFPRRFLQPGGGSAAFFYEGADAAEYVRGVLEPNIKEAFEDDMRMRGYKRMD